MILRLIYKDLVAYKKIIILILLYFMVAGSFIVFRYWSWHVYMMYGYMAITFISTFFSFTEKNRNTEILTCSIPVTRSSIVIARYLTLAILAVGGLALWFINAYASSTLYIDAKTNFDNIIHLKVLFIALFFISIYASIFLPAVFSFKLMGTVFTFIIALVAAVTSIALIFHPYSRSYNPYFENGDIILISVLTSIMVVAPSISLAVSLNVYKRKDI